MFGMVLATGIKVLAMVNFNTNRYNADIVAISLGLSMILIVAADFFTQMPANLQPLLHSGILLSSVAAMLLNLYFNGYHPEKKPGADDVTNNG